MDEKDDRRCWKNYTLSLLNNNTWKHHESCGGVSWDRTNVCVHHKILGWMKPVYLCDYTNSLVGASTSRNVAEYVFFSLLFFMMAGWLCLCYYGLLFLTSKCSCYYTSQFMRARPRKRIVCEGDLVKKPKMFNNIEYSLVSIIYVSVRFCVYDVSNGTNAGVSLDSSSSGSSSCRRIIATITVPRRKFTYTDDFIIYILCILECVASQQVEANQPKQKHH